MSSLLQDLRFAGRALRKRPGLSAVAILTLALGLGANAAVFAIVDALVIRPYGFPDIDRIVLLAETSPRERFRRETVARANFLDWRRQVESIQHLSGLDWWDANLVGRDEPERVQGFFVSAGFFEALGVRPAFGRTFVRDDEVRGRHQRVVLGYGLWQRRFASDAGLVGRSIIIDGVPHEVVGIARQGFHFPQGSELWAPLSFDARAAANRTARTLTVIGRLAPGRTLEQAQAQMSVVGERLAREHPEANRDRGIQVHTLAQGMRDVGLGPILSLWQASALFVLLIACANIANLLIARASERRREIAVRLALGAGRGRIVRELLAESALLAATAIPLSLVFTAVGLRLLRGAMPARIARFVDGWQNINVDGRLLLYTTAVAVATILIFGLLPALQATRRRLVESLNEGGRGTGAGAGRQRLRRGLVVAEIALALPLLVAAGLSVMGTYRFLNGPQGYDPDQLLTLKLVLPEARYPDAEARRQFTARALAELRGVPGVTHVAAANVTPSAGSGAVRQIEIDGRPSEERRTAPRVDWRVITPAYLETMRIPMLQGRSFTTADREGSALVAIVSDAMARQLWPGASPIGARVRVLDGEWLTIVGVCSGVVHDWFLGGNVPTLYVPFDQQPTGYMSFVARTAGDPLDAAPGARAALRRVDAVQPIFDVMSMRQQLKDRTIGLQFISSIMTVFAGLALVLAIVGVYAVMAFLVTQRTHEFGVRVAIGATPRDLVALGVRQAVVLSAIGVVLGLAAAAALSRLIEAGLLGTVSSDMRLFVGFALVLVASALTAGYIPARRAAKLDPVVALRGE
ncbi:MAG TPA: ABC transporter permease [Vicinamibacterales bacterium]|nr:ABC transporter permease [Vicinamibacterales bacterium]